MASKKAAAAAAADAADIQKKRKRDKVEDAGRSRKRKLKEAAEAKAPATPESANKKKNSSGTPVGKKAGHGGTPRAVADQQPTAAATWKLSKPMGGSMSDVDPIFSADEEHLIITYHTSIQVYSTADSLLERHIRLPEGDRPARIVAIALSPKSPELVWIGCINGALYRANWTTGVVESVKRTSEHAPVLAGLTAELVRFGHESREVLFLSEGSPGAWCIAAYEADALAQSAGHMLFTAPAGSVSTAIELLRTADNGRFVVGVSGKVVFVGSLRPAAAGDPSPKTVADLAYQVYLFDGSDEIASLDVRTVRDTRGAALDLIVGCARGSIYVYSDVFNRLDDAAAAKSKGLTKKNKDLRPRKYRWHGRCVNAVKWSGDGNYFISGGYESVLVTWQVDTSKVSVLPHLQGTIENIVVAPRGASYAIHLDDNSTMVISTAEQLPTFYVAGLQSLTLSHVPPKDAHVRRAWQPVDTITKPVPAAVDPTEAARIWLRVGNGQKASMTGDAPSAALLQTFDVASFCSVSRKPLARTNPTDSNLTTRGHPLTEPTITHLCPSLDGRWLASVDEWQPPERDISGVPGEPSLKGEWARDRREVHLKFWEVRGKEESAGVAKGQGSKKSSSSGSGSSGDDAATTSGGSSEDKDYELITRIDEAHFTTRTESIFAVVADSGDSNRFATLGDDAVVRFWGPKVRVHDGIVTKDTRGRPMVSWHCTQAVALPLGEGDSNKRVTTRGGSGGRSRRSGALAFSEDGSTVFAAFGGPGEAVLYTIDAASGVVRDTLQGMFRGDVRGVAVMGASLILLSADLRIYDIVADELRYGLHLLDSIAPADTELASALTQLAVGRHANAFVVAVPYKLGPAEPSSLAATQVSFAAATAAAAAVAKDGAKTKAPSRFASQLVVYSPDHAQPLFTKNLPSLVVSLLPGAGASGFLAIDSAAQMWSLADAADTALLGQSLEDMHLPTSHEDAAVAVVVDSQDDDEDDEADADNGDAQMADGNDDEYGNDDVHDVVIAPQKLRDIFDAAPATGATSIEDLFWEVSGLLSGLPSVVRAG